MSQAAKNTTIPSWKLQSGFGIGSQDNDTMDIVIDNTFNPLPMQYRVLEEGLSVVQRFKVILLSEEISVLDTKLNSKFFAWMELASPYGVPNKLALADWIEKTHVSKMPILAVAISWMMEARITYSTFEQLAELIATINQAQIKELLSLDERPKEMPMTTLQNTGLIKDESHRLASGITTTQLGADLKRIIQEAKHINTAMMKEM